MSPSDPKPPGAPAGQRASASPGAPARTATAPRPGPGTARTTAGPRAGEQAGPTRPAASAATPVSSASKAAAAPGAPRRVRLNVARVDPWSVMKLSFLLSVGIGIAIVVATGVLWSVLDGMGVFTDVNSVVGQILADSSFDVNDYVGFRKVISLATVIAVVDVVLITAIATLGAFLYNLASTLVGGLHVTLSDD